MTAAISFRLLCQSNGFQTTSLGSYGLDELRWLKPVKPDDTLRVSMEIKDLRRSKSRPSLVLRRVILKQLIRKMRL